MMFRQALPQEINFIFSEGFKEWSKGRTYEQYCSDNAKEDGYGTRYVLDVDNEIVSSLIILKLQDIAPKKAYGMGSVLTPKIHAGQGYAKELIKKCLQLEKEDCFVFLFSDINPEFYRQFNFRILPPHFQKYEKSVCMVYCNDVGWKELMKGSIDSMPNYF